MAVTKMTLLALLACAMVMGASARWGPAASVLPQPIFRLVSLTQYNSSANLTHLMDLELIGANNCSASIMTGIMGINANISVNTMWGSLVKIYDFPDSNAFVVYQNCSDEQTTRFETKAYETGKFYVGMSTLPMCADQPALLPEDCMNGTFCNTYMHASVANTSDAQLTVTQRHVIFSAFTGMSYGSYADVDTGFIAAQYPTKMTADVAIGNNFAEPQGGSAYYYYKHGWQTPPGNIPKLPLYVSIGNMQTTPSYEIEFVPYRVK